MNASLRHEAKSLMMVYSLFFLQECINSNKQTSLLFIKKVTNKVLTHANQDLFRLSYFLTDIKKKARKLVKIKDTIDNTMLTPILR